MYHLRHTSSCFSLLFTRTLPRVSYHCAIDKIMRFLALIFTFILFLRWLWSEHQRLGSRTWTRKNTWYHLTSQWANSISLFASASICDLKTLSSSSFKMLFLQLAPPWDHCTKSTMKKISSCISHIRMNLSMDHPIKLCPSPSFPLPSLLTSTLNPTEPGRVRP